MRPGALPLAIGAAPRMMGERMAGSVFHLFVAPVGEPGDRPARCAVRLERIVDDGRHRSSDPVDDVSGETLLVDPDWLRLAGRARAAPRELAGELGPALLRAGRELFAALPAAVRRELQLAFDRDEQARLIVTAEGDASLLPWEALGVEPLHGTGAVRFPVLRGQVQLLRRPPGLDVAAVGPVLEPRILLVLLDDGQQPGAQHAGHDRARVVAAARAAGFHLRVVSASAAVPSSELDERLSGPDDLLRLVRTRGFTVVHLVGKSDAATWEPAAHQPEPSDPFGASGLELAPGVTLQATALADALRDGGVPAVLAQACDVRETVAEALLRRGGVEHLACTGAFVDPDSCACWAEGFYRGLRTFRAMGPALREAAKALDAREHHRNEQLALLWWSRSDDDLTFADDDQRLLERYCRALAASVARFEGRFEQIFGAGRLVDVYVELHVDERALDGEAERRTKLDERDGALPPECPFEHLLGLHTREFLLGGPAGMGKTTTLRMHARRLAEDRRRALVPIVVSLARWIPAGSTSVRRLVEHVAGGLQFPDVGSTRLADLLDARGQSGGLAVFLDGYDELGVDERQGFESALNQLRKDWPGCRFVVATRRYRHTGKIDGLVDVDIEPLRPARAAELLERVLRLKPRTADRAAELAAQWQHNFAGPGRAWRELGETPLFVVLLGELLGRGRQPASDRLEFFHQVFDLLCRSEHNPGRPPLVTAHDDEVDDGDIPPAVDEQLDRLGRIALAMTGATTIDIRRDELVERARAAGILKPNRWLIDIADRTSILGPDAALPPRDAEDPPNPAATALADHDDDDAPWRFWHRSFQEALTAWELRRRLRAGEPVDAVVAAIRLEPTDAEIERAQRELANEWHRSWDDDPDSTVFFDALWARFPSWTAEGQQRVVKHQQGGRWSRTVVVEAARAEAPAAARRALLDFWIEPLALLAGALVRAALDGPTEAERSAAAGQVESLLQAIAQSAPGVPRAPDLVREILLRLDRLPPALWRLGLDATIHGDARGRDATDGRALWIWSTGRLTDRAALYHALADRLATLCDTPADRALAAAYDRALGERAGMVDDPGELYLVLRCIEALSARGFAAAASAASAASAGAIRSRLDEAPPDAAAWRAHFVAIAGGRFQCGSEAGEPRERPVHDVELSRFWLGGTPVTVGLYRQFWPQHRMSVDGHAVVTLASWKGAIDGEPVGELPVSYVSWYAAQMLCRWLRHHWEAIAGDDAELIGLVPVLPTEAQAEFAIRGGPGGTGDWWFGDEERARSCAWYADNSGGRFHAVGLKERNGLGLADVVGNVWWWCRDAFDPRAYELRVKEEPVRDPVASGPDAAPRVVRGGSFVGPVRLLRSAVRSWLLPAVADRGLGVRVALVPASSELGSDIENRS
ncbi:MAG: SUMF1/EgtB/PvdO family nonheme iron enzyme [Planctomycetes bacterium]|nr:SUMF1/EgtB/PvdO family nonheme iron enzyme [Planctomycetota bacterium]